MDNCIHGVDARNPCKKCDVYQDMVLGLKIAKAKLVKLNEQAADALVNAAENTGPLVAQILETRAEISELQPKVEAETARRRWPF